MSAAADTLFFQNTFTTTRQRAATVPLRLPVSLWRLLDLLAENGEDDYGAIGPSQLAFLRAFRLVAEALAILGEDFASSPSVDSEGGIRVTWRRGDRQVKLVCPARREASVYIYYAGPAGNGLLNQGVSAPDLAGRLDWLINRECSAAPA